MTTMAHDTLRLAAGTLLFTEGDAGSCAFMVVSGILEIFLCRGGAEIVLARRGPGEIVGEMAIIDARPRSASVRVAADCELRPVTRDQIAHRLAGTDPILRMCLGVVIARYREMVDVIDAGDRRRVEREPARANPDFEKAIGDLSLEHELKRALARDEFELHFQPIVAFPSRRLAGFEALVRWNHPDKGLVPPQEFIPLAEVSGLIGEITAWCLRDVGAVFPRMVATALGNVDAVDRLFISVNISGHDLAAGDSFVGQVASMLTSSGIDARSVKLEITESVLMKDPQQAVATLDALRRLGVTIAIDDFGTGYSSLSYLSTLPITTIKIDRSFVRAMSADASSHKIVQMILRLADELVIPVVAEGIEEAAEADALESLGCAFGQGYLFGRPQTLSRTLALISAWKRDGASKARSGADARGRETIARPALAS